jgi:hypothetical protein
MSSVSPSLLFDLLQKNSADALKPIIPDSVRAYSCLDLHGLTDSDLLQDQPPLISIAVYLNTLNSASFLVRHGADLDATDVLFFLSITASPFSSHREPVHFLASAYATPETVDFLKSKSVDFNAYDVTFS